MPEAPTRPNPPPDPLALQATALRYAARELPPDAAAAFESRLADDQEARDALSEAVRLSAAALGQEPPAPDRTFRALIRERLRPPARWAGWLARRAYRGHPLTWAGPPRAPARTAAARPGRTRVRPAVAPDPRPVVAAQPDEAALKTAEIWAELSTPDHVGRAHDEELRRRQRLRDWHLPHALAHPGRPADEIGARAP